MRKQALRLPRCETESKKLGIIASLELLKTCKMHCTTAAAFFYFFYANCYAFKLSAKKCKKGKRAVCANRISTLKQALRLPLCETKRKLGIAS